MTLGQAIYALVGQAFIIESEVKNEKAVIPKFTIVMYDPTFQSKYILYRLRIKLFI